MPELLHARFFRSKNQIFGPNSPVRTFQNERTKLTRNQYRAKAYLLKYSEIPEDIRNLAKF